MITNEQITLVEQLVAAGVSQRAISQQCGVSRDTIRRILRGERVRTAAAPAPIISPVMSRPARRCPGCGRRVHWPCLACQLSDTRRATRV